MFSPPAHIECTISTDIFSNTKGFVYNKTNVMIRTGLVIRAITSRVCQPRTQKKVGARDERCVPVARRVDGEEDGGGHTRALCAGPARTCTCNTVPHTGGPRTEKRRVRQDRNMAATCTNRNRWRPPKVNGNPMPTESSHRCRCRARFALLHAHLVAVASGHEHDA